MKLKENRKILVFVTMGLIFFVGLCFRWQNYSHSDFSHSFIQPSDQNIFIESAINIVKNHDIKRYPFGSPIRSQFPPFYDLYLAFFFAIFGIYPGIEFSRILMILLDTSNFIIIYFSIRNLFTQQWPLIPLIPLAFLCIHPLMVNSSIDIMTDSLSLVLFSLSLFFWTRIWGNKSKNEIIDGMLLGLFAGLTILTRVAYLGLILFLAVSILVKHFTQDKKQFLSLKLLYKQNRGIITSLIIALLILNLWMVRNRFVIGAYTMSSHAGRVFVVGNHPGAVIDGYSEPLGRVANPDIFHRFEKDWNAYYFNEAKKWIFKNPCIFLSNVFWRFVHFWTKPFNDSFWPFFSILLLPAFFTLFYLRLFTKLLPIYFFSLYYALTLSLSFFVTRHRFPMFEPILIVSTPSLLLIEKWFNNRRDKLKVIIGMTILVGCIVLITKIGMDVKKTLGAIHERPKEFYKWVRSTVPEQSVLLVDENPFQVTKYTKIPSIFAHFYGIEGRLHPTQAMHLNQDTCYLVDSIPYRVSSIKYSRLTHEEIYNQTLVGTHFFVFGETYMKYYLEYSHPFLEQNGLLFSYRLKGIYQGDSKMALYELEYIKTAGKNDQ
jgi:hypothetical protein